MIGTTGPASEAAASARQPRRPRLYEAGLFLVVVVVPLAFLPFTTSPFADVKLLALAAGCLLIWASAPPIDRIIAIVAGAWFGVSVLAAMFGVDPGRSLTGAENAPAGLALVLASAYLVAIGAAMPGELRARIPRWVAATAAIVAVIVVIWRIWPGALSFMGALRFTGSTLGVGPFLAAFLALGLLALPHLRLPLWQSIAAALLFGLALGGTPHRAALISTAIGFVFSVWYSGAVRKTVVIIAVSASVGFVVWSLFPPGASSKVGGSVIQQSFADRPPNSRRLSVLTAIVRSTAERPILGWGPGNTLSSWSAGLRAEDFPVEERFNDAHNIVIEQVSATGFLGVLAFLALAGTLAVRILRSPRPVGWLAGAAVVMVLLHLTEPMNVAMTSLGFLVIGMAGAGADAAVVDPAEGWRVGRVATGGMLVATLVVSVLTLISAVLEHVERTQYVADHGLLRLATTLTPWRVVSTSDLATQLALDGRAGDDARAAEALELARRMLEEHPEYPPAYFDAVVVHRLVMDPEGAARVIAQFEERFPLIPPSTFESDTEPSTRGSGG